MAVGRMTATTANPVRRASGFASDHHAEQEGRTAEDDPSRTEDPRPAAVASGNSVSAPAAHQAAHREQQESCHSRRRPRFVEPDRSHLTAGRVPARARSSRDGPGRGRARRSHFRLRLIGAALELVNQRAGIVLRRDTGDCATSGGRRNEPDVIQARASADVGGRPAAAKSWSVTVNTMRR